MSSFIISSLILAIFVSVRSSWSYCLPQHPCFPDEQTWSSFNSSLRGNLLRLLPPAAPCHHQHLDHHACEAAKHLWTKPFWRSAQPGAMQDVNWEMSGEDSCLITPANRTPTCYQGSVPLYAVKVTDPSHVQLAVTFASTYKLRLVIKSTGHDYLGRSTAAGALCIWLHHLKSIRFHEYFPCESSSSDGGSSTSAVTVGGGVQWEEVYREAFERKLVVVGGGCSSVGAAGGYPQGGGHSLLSPALGLAADNVLEYEVVTADGKLRRANGCENSRLFWALRGGGGGTFGVVVSVTYKTHSAFKSLVFAPYNFTARSSATFHRLLNTFMRLSPGLSSAGWSGYLSLSSRSLVLSYLLPDRDVLYALQTLEPILSYVKTRPEEVQLTGSLKTFGSFWEWHLEFQCGGQPSCYNVSGLGVSFALASRLVPTESFRSSVNLGKLSARMVSIMEEQVPSMLVILLGNRVNVVHDNAVSSAWRKALWLLIVPASWSENATVTEKARVREKVSSANRRLLDVLPESGSYVNEADYNEPEWQRSFFGERYSRLLSIKREVDPTGLFMCYRCVGSEIVVN